MGARPVPWERVCRTDPRRRPGRGSGSRTTPVAPGRALRRQGPKLDAASGYRRVAPAPGETPGRGLRGRVRETSCSPEARPRALVKGLPPGRPEGTPDPATGSVGGPLGQTGRLGLATERSARGAGALRWRVTFANRSVCLAGAKRGREPQFAADYSGTGAPDGTPRGSAASPEASRGRRLEACVSENWVSEIVTMVAWRCLFWFRPPSGGASRRFGDGSPSDGRNT